jgi:hypothetical protein
MSRTEARPVALASVALAAGLAAWGTFGGTEDGQIVEYLVVCAIIAVGALVVFGWAVPRFADSDAAARTALVLSVLGLLSIAVFWTGLPPVLAAGGALLGWAARGRALAKAAIVVGALALVADVVVYVTDMT